MAKSTKPRTPHGVDANLLADLMKWARAAGADSAEAFYIHGESLSVAQRLGKREKLEGSEGRDLRLRAFVGQRSASVSSTDFAPKALRALVERAVDMARAVPEDPYAGIAPAEQLAKTWPELDLDDKRQPPSAKRLLSLAGSWHAEPGASEHRKGDEADPGEGAGDGPAATIGDPGAVPT